MDASAAVSVARSFVVPETQQAPDQTKDPNRQTTGRAAQRSRRRIHDSWLELTF